ncbi:MAG: GNAT family N-acetyltransferase [Planctomycetaceae bacterium]
MHVDYNFEPNLTVDEFVDIFHRSTLAERRPVNEPDRLRKMLENSDIVLTARIDGRLVGIARAITDYSACTYLADLAVDAEFQRQGIGRELVRRTHETAGRQTTLVLLAAPKAVGYYPRIGMTRHKSCWTASRDSEGSDANDC